MTRAEAEDEIATRKKREEFVERLEEASDEILDNTSLRCTCGWSGQVKDAPNLDKDGWRLCPNCKCFDGLMGGKGIEEPDSEPVKCKWCSWTGKLNETHEAGPSKIRMCPKCKKGEGILSDGGSCAHAGGMP